MSTLRIFLISAASFFLFFCGIYRHDVDKSAYTKLAAEPQFDCVGKIFKRDTFGGSCVLIGDRYLLTALHGVLERQGKITVKGDTFNGSNIIFPSAIIGDAIWFSAEFAGKRYPVKRIIAQSKDTEHGFDLVVIELDRPVPGIKPARLYAGFDELHQIMTGVGYGKSGPSDKIDSMKSQQYKIAGTNIVDLFEGELYHDRQTMMRMDFDHPTDTTYNTTGSSTATPLEYLPMGGDSGGGLFIRTKSGWELAGLCHGGANIKELMHTMRTHNYYGVTCAWLRISVFRDWILKQIK